MHKEKQERIFQLMGAKSIQATSSMPPLVIWKVASSSGIRGLRDTEIRVRSKVPRYNVTAF